MRQDTCQCYWQQGHFLLNLSSCRDLCISTGRSLCHFADRHADPASHSGLSSVAASAHMLHIHHRLPLVNWRSIYFQQSHALSFNGINDYIQLPAGLFNSSRSLSDEWGCQSSGLTIDMMVLAHQLPSSPHPEGVTSKTVTSQAGGMLFGCQDREFGRSRRAARLHTLALLYVGTDGFLHSQVGTLTSSMVLADSQWHRVTLTLIYSEEGVSLATACMYIDGVLDQVVHDCGWLGLPSYPIVGSGVTEAVGCPYGASMPVYNCHTFHGLIDEFRLWGRALQSFEVSPWCLRSQCYHHAVPNPWISL